MAFSKRHELLLWLHVAFDEKNWKRLTVHFEALNMILKMSYGSSRCDEIQQSWTAFSNKKLGVYRKAELQWFWEAREEKSKWGKCLCTSVLMFMLYCRFLISHIGLLTCINRFDSVLTRFCFRAPAINAQFRPFAATQCFYLFLFDFGSFPEEEKCL